jgi:hypothetical protein
MASMMTSSPIRLIRRSTRSRLTRIVAGAEPADCTGVCAGSCPDGGEDLPVIRGFSPLPSPPGEVSHALPIAGFSTAPSSTGGGGRSGSAGVFADSMGSERSGSTCDASWPSTVSNESCATSATNSKTASISSRAAGETSVRVQRRRGWAGSNSASGATAASSHATVSSPSCSSARRSARGSFPVP